MLEQALEVLDTVTARMNSENRIDMGAHHKLQGEIALARGDHDEATDHFELAFALFDNQHNLESLAFCALASGDIELARQRYEQLRGRRQLGSEAQEAWMLAHYLLGRIYEEQGDTLRAVDRYSQFVDIWQHGDDDLEPLIDARRRIRYLVGLER